MQGKTMQHKFQGRPIFISFHLHCSCRRAAQLVLGQDTTTFVTEFPGLLANVDTIAISKARKDANALFHSKLHITWQATLHLLEFSLRSCIKFIKLVPASPGNSSSRISAMASRASMMTSSSLSSISSSVSSSGM